MQAQQPSVQAPQALPGLPPLSQPIRCTVGKDCVVQFYPDADPGNDVRDFHCGRTTYPAHRGTDIRVGSMDDVRRGVEVLAAAPGVVAAIRDGEPDIDVNLRGRDALVRSGKSGGNLVVLRHGNGWTSFYWHMRQGSLRVQPGKQVAAGDVLGLVGLSGDTNFPHLHFELRYRNQVVDPFTGTEPRVVGRCGVTGKPLWTPEAAAALGWHDVTLIQAGFADRAPGRRGSDEHAPPTSLSARSEILAFWWELSGVEMGDKTEVRILGTNGEVLAERTQTYDQRQGFVFDFIGRTSRSKAWPVGLYSASLRLIRADRALIDEVRWLDVR